jgi:hypothetical protein
MSVHASLLAIGDESAMNFEGLGIFFAKASFLQISF